MRRSKSVLNDEMNNNYNLENNEEQNQANKPKPINISKIYEIKSKDIYFLS